MAVFLVAVLSRTALRASPPAVNTLFLGLALGLGLGFAFGLAFGLAFDLAFGFAVDAVLVDAFFVVVGVFGMRFAVVLPV